MELLKNLSAIIALTSCAVVTFLIRRKFTFKFFSVHKTLKEGNNSEQDFKIPALPNPNWVKVGSVQKLNIYPVNSGVKTSCSTVKFTLHGIISEKKGLLLWDRMFRIYDEQTKQVQNEQDLEDIMQLNMNVVDESKVRFRAGGMPNLIVNLTDKTHKILTEMSTNWIAVRYIDCGDAAANWMNIYFRGSTLRLIRAEYEIIDEPKIDPESLIRQPDMQVWELLMILTRYAVITLESLKKIETETPWLNIKPNIVISAPSFPALAENDWEWIKIGNIIMNKILPVSSLQPNSNEILQNKNIQPHYMGIYYGLCGYTGDMNVNSDVFVHMEESKK